jgi:hypothetical protein
VPSSTQLSSARQAATAAAAAAAAKRAKITFDIGAGESQKRTFKLVRDQNKANEVCSQTLWHRHKRVFYRRTLMKT